jgi:hypothetical protein
MRFFYNAENAMKLSVIAAMMLAMSCAASSRTKPIEPWSVAVTSSGGLAGKGAGSYAINSAGEITVTTMTGKVCAMAASEADMARFNTLLTNARPNTWSASYIPKESCCDRFEYQLTLDEAGTKHAVKWIDDPLPMPNDLAALTDAMVGGAESLRVRYGAQCR